MAERDDRERLERARRIIEGKFGPALTHLSQIIDGVVAQTCHRHYAAGTQEHQFTSKVADAVEREIERELARAMIDNVRVEVRLQDFSDKGAKSTEKRSGSDLYISVVLQTPEVTMSKGMLVQSKWDDTMRDPKLQEQLDKMLDRSAASYVWVYERNNIVVVPAQNVVKGTYDPADTETVGQMIANGLRCFEGDSRIGRSLNEELGLSLRRIQEEVAANRALSFTVRAVE